PAAGAAVGPAAGAAVATAAGAGAAVGPTAGAAVATAAPGSQAGLVIGCPPGQGEQGVEVAVGGDQVAHPGDSLARGRVTFGRGDQAEVPGRRDDVLGPPDRAVDGQAG